MAESCKEFTVNIYGKLMNFVRFLDDPTISTVDSLLRKLIPYRPAALMLERLLYWFPKAKKAGDWVYKSKRDWMSEEDLSAWEVKQAHAGRYLEQVGVERILKKAKGAPTNHYRLNVQNFLQALANFARITVLQVKAIFDSDNFFNAPNGQNPPDAKSDNLPMQTDESAQSLTTEISTGKDGQNTVVVPTLSNEQIPLPVQKKLIARFGSERVQAMIDYAIAYGAANIGGFVRQGLEENWIVEGLRQNASYSRLNKTTDFSKYNDAKYDQFRDADGYLDFAAIYFAETEHLPKKDYTGGKYAAYVIS